ncbi:MAG: MFS transporter [Candidatus Limnocylindrales bacterium]
MALIARRSLWRHRDFLKIWSAATASSLGSQITFIAMPFIALKMLGASVFQVSLLVAVEMLPFLLLTLPAGAWLDRVRRRPVLVAADIGRGVVLLSIPVAWVIGSLTIWHLYAVAFVTGSFTAFFDIADQSYLPAILDRDDLVEGNADLQISYAVAQIGGPTMGGNLIAIVAAPWAIAVDALSFFFSGAFISAIRRREQKPVRRLDESGRPTSIRADISDGLRYVLGNRYLRPIAACTGTSNLFGAALFGVFPVLIWNELKLPPAFYGTVMGAAGVGFLVGAALSSRLPRSLGIGRTIIVSAALGSPAYVLLTLTPESLGLAAVTLGVGWFVVAMSQVIYNVAQISLRQAITAPEMQGRMNATMRFIVWGTIPIGSVLGGALATLLPVRVALILAALASFTAVVPVLVSPLRSLRNIPSEDGPVEGDGAVAGARSPAAPARAPEAAAGSAAATSGTAAAPGALKNEAGLPWTGSPAVRPASTGVDRS